MEFVQIIRKNGGGKPNIMNEYQKFKINEGLKVANTIKEWLDYVWEDINMGWGIGDTYELNWVDAGALIDYIEDLEKKVDK